MWAMAGWPVEYWAAGPCLKKSLIEIKTPQPPIILQSITCITITFCCEILERPQHSNFTFHHYLNDTPLCTRKQNWTPFCFECCHLHSCFKFSHVFQVLYLYLLANKPTVKWSKASDQEEFKKVFYPFVFWF